MGDHNTFEPKSKVSQTVLLGSFSTVGAACTLTSGISTTTRSTSSEMIEGTELDEILNFDEKPKEKPRVKEEETKGHTIGEEKELEMKEEEEGTRVISKDEEPIAIPKVQEPFSPEQLPDNLVIYGKDSRSRIWSGEGVKQAAALHAKHLSYLQDSELFVIFDLIHRGRMTVTSFRTRTKLLGFCHVDVSDVFSPPFPDLSLITWTRTDIPKFHKLKIIET